MIILKVGKCLAPLVQTKSAGYREYRMTLLFLFEWQITSDMFINILGENFAQAIALTD